MRNKAGTTCITLGAVLLLAALSLFLWNKNEEDRAAKSAERLIPQILQQIDERIHETADPAAEEEVVAIDDVFDAIANQPDETTATTEMAEVMINGYKYIGYLLFPTLELEVPVISECDTTKLKTAPCRYSGSTVTDDLVIAGHNYTRHFGKIPLLSAGDSVYFVDMDGSAIEYSVVAIDILAATDIEEMTAGDYDLSLFTCDYSGQNRITLRCDRAD